MFISSDTASFRSFCFAHRYQTYARSNFCFFIELVRDDQQRSSFIQPKGNSPFFFVAVLYVEQRQRFRIFKHCSATFERDAMFSRILSGFRWVPSNWY